MAVQDPASPGNALSRPGWPQYRSPNLAPAGTDQFLTWFAGMFSRDRQYHLGMATLTASENYVSLAVRAAAAFLGGEHYFFDPPTPAPVGEWSFPDPESYPTSSASSCGR